MASPVRPWAFFLAGSVGRVGRGVPGNPFWPKTMNNASFTSLVPPFAERVNLAAPAGISRCDFSYVYRGKSHQTPPPTISHCGTPYTDSQPMRSRPPLRCPTSSACWRTVVPPYSPAGNLLVYQLTHHYPPFAFQARREMSERAR